MRQEMLATGSAPREPGCPAPEQLAQYLDGQLGTAGRESMEQHLLDCPDCRAVIVETVISLEESTATEPSSGVFLFPSRRRWPTLRVTALWTGAVGALAAGIVLTLNPMAIRMRKPAVLSPSLSIVGRPSVGLSTSQGRTADARITPELGEGRGTAASRNIATLDSSSLGQRDLLETSLRETQVWRHFRDVYNKLPARLVAGRLFDFPHGTFSTASALTSRKGSGVLTSPGTQQAQSSKVLDDAVMSAQAL